MLTTDNASNIEARPTMEPITADVIFFNRAMINNRNSSREDGNCHFRPAWLETSTAPFRRALHLLL
jgi:hypothetical protein